MARGSEWWRHPVVTGVVIFCLGFTANRLLETLWSRGEAALSAVLAEVFVTEELRAEARFIIGSSHVAFVAANGDTPLADPEAKAMAQRMADEGLAFLKEASSAGYGAANMVLWDAYRCGVAAGIIPRDEALAAYYRERIPRDLELPPELLPRVCSVATAG